jgi:hypothetical protein
MFEIKSTESDATLEFSNFSGDYFTVSLRSSTHFASREVYAGTDSQGIARLLQEAAEQWRSWQGIKQWQSVLGELQLELKSNHKGHISLTAKINNESGHPDPWKIEATLSVEAGQLDSLSQKAAGYFKQKEG